MANRFAILAGGAALALLTGCSSFPNFPGTGRSAPDQGSLPAADVPAYATGDTFVFDQDGAITQERVVAVSPDRVTWTDDESDSSVIWTRDPYIVTPPLNWSAHPELGRGRQAIIGSPEQLFPLREGNKVAYVVRGSSETLPEGWQDEHSCDVMGQETVQVKAGTYTTFKILCQRRDYTDTLYYSPVVQNVVLRDRNIGGRTSRKELVSVNLSNDRTANLAASTPIAPNAPTPTPVVTADQTGAPMPMTSAASAGAAAGTAAMMMPGMAQGTSGTMPASPIERRLDRLEVAVDRLEKAAGLAPLAGTAPRSAGAGAANPSRAPTQSSGASGMMQGPWAVHLASYRAMGRAQAGWTSLKRKFPQLDKLSMLTSEFDPGNGRGTYVRLMARGFPTRAEATAFCRPLKSAGQFCEAKGPLP
jgi:hypothetical protein